MKKENWAIGTDVKLCPKCYYVISYKDDVPYCRQCGVIDKRSLITEALDSRECIRGWADIVSCTRCR